MQWSIEVRDCFASKRRHPSPSSLEAVMLRTSSLALLTSLGLFAGSIGCGGSEASDSSADTGAPIADSGVRDSGAIDSGSGVDSIVATDTAVADTRDATPPPTDTPPGTALIRIANMLWFPTPTNVRVCLVDSTTGASSLIEPSGVTGGLPYQTVTNYVLAPTGSSFVVHLVAATGDCSSPSILAAGAPLDAPIEDGKSYLLAVAREPGEGDYAMVRLSPDLPPPGTDTTARTRAFNMLYTTSRVGITVSWGGGSVLFPSLAPGDVPTTSSAGTPSPEGYVDVAGDATTVDVVLTGAGTVGHFTLGFFFTSRNTYYVTGAPPGGPMAPQIVYCHDDLSDASFTRCDTISAGP
jgi:hypothetical protein